MSTESLLDLTHRIETLGGAQFILDSIASGKGMKQIADELKCSPFNFAKWRDKNLEPDELALAVQVYYDGLAEEGTNSIRVGEDKQDIQRGSALVKAAIEVGQYNSAKFRITKEKAETVIHLNADLASMYALPPGTTIDQLPMKQISDASAQV